MTEKELLQMYLEQECEVIFATSANYAMTVPKKGSEAEWRAAYERKELLEKMLRREESR